MARLLKILAVFFVGIHFDKNVSLNAWVNLGTNHLEFHTCLLVILLVIVTFFFALRAKQVVETIDSAGWRTAALTQDDWLPWKHIVCSACYMLIPREKAMIMLVGVRFLALHHQL